MSSAIKGLTPQRVWEYFAGLSAIPRCSKHEQKAAAWVLGIAKKLRLEAEQDRYGNVVVRKPASSGRASLPAVALQSHLDMVCEKNSASAHDFGRDPIALRRDGGFLTAAGTTLGADNGIGVCLALAIMEDSTLRHGPLEFLFTVDEETGLTGASNLKKGFIKARRLINLDTEEEGALFVGCSGGIDTRGTLPVGFERPPAGSVPLRVRVTGLSGGHSGIDIHIGRANAIKLLAGALRAFAGSACRICSVEGGNKHNAIPREASAIIAAPGDSVEAVRKLVEECDARYRKEFSAVDSGLVLRIDSVAGPVPRVLKPKSQGALLKLLSDLPHGVVAMSRDIPGLVETSTNLAVVTTGKRSVVVQTSQRSSIPDSLRRVVDSVKKTFGAAGCSIRNSDGYPGWKPDLASPLLKTARETYRSLFGQEPLVKAVHAGLECGVIGEKFPGMDMISIGPTLRLVHSPGERVEIASVKKCADFLAAVLELL